MSWDRFLDALEAAGSGPRLRGTTHLDARCPAHEDRNPSLTADYDEADGKTLVCCQAGCAPDAVAAALGLRMSDLFDAPPTRPDRPRATPRRLPVRKAPAAKRAQVTAAAKLGPPVATYVYADAAGRPVMRVLRFAPADGGKTFRQEKRVGGKWVSGAPAAADRVLYRLPEVAAAAAAGGVVFLVEGEKDADALVTAGEVATTSPMGAGKWLAHYTEQLRGAQVVLVVDRDHLSPKRSSPNWKDDGAIHSLAVLDSLTAAGVAVAGIVEAAEGKDTADHLAAGHATAQLVPVEVETLRRRATASPSVDDAGDTEAGGAAVARRLVVVDQAAQVTAELTGRPQYARGQDCLVRVRQVNGKTEYSLVLEGLARIVRQEQAEVDGEVHTVTLVLAVAPDRDSPEEEMRVAAELFDSGAWLRDLPFRTWYRSSRTGVAEAIDAVKQTSDYATVRQHRRLGWIDTSAGPAYVHAGGLIDATGAVSGYTNLTGALAQHELPNPPSDPGEIRAAAAHSLGLLTQLPTHLGAVLAGLAYRAPLGWTASTLMLRGNPGNYKTALANVAMHHFRPGSRHYDATFSLTTRGHTANSPGELLFRGKDSLLFADDAAPDKTVREASVLLTETLRTQYNRTGKARLTREGVLREVHAPAGSLIVASEVGASTQSGQERALEVAITAGDVSIETVTALYEPAARHARAAVTASYVRWLAGRLDEAGSRADSLRLEYAARFREQAALSTRPADAIAELAVGWRFMLDHLLAVGAASPAEAETTWAAAWAGLVDVGRRQHDADAETGHADRFTSLLRSVLRSGAGYIATLDGRCPTPDNPTRCGWTLDPRGGGRDPVFPPAMVPGGLPIGLHVDREDGELLWLDRNTTLAAVRKLAAATGAHYEQTERAIAEALDEAGLLLVEQRGGRRRRTIRRPGGGEREPGWGVRWAALWDDPDGSGDPLDPEPPVTPAPTAPGPDDAPPDSGPADRRPPPVQLEFTLCRTRFSSEEAAWLSPAQPCAVCGQGAAIALWGVPTHVPTCQDQAWLLTHPGQALPEPAPARGPEAAPAARASHPAAAAAGWLATARSTPAGAVSGRWRAPAAVLDAAGVFLPGGEVLPWPADLDHLGGVAQLAEDLRLGHGGDRKHLPAQGAVFVTDAGADRLGLGRRGERDADAVDKLRGRAQNAPAVLEARVAGWQLGNRDPKHPTGQLDGWTRLYRAGGGRGMAVGLLSWLPAAVPLFAGDPTPAAIAERLARFAATFGIPYRLTPAATGLDLMTWTRPAGSDPTHPIDPEALTEPAQLPDIAHDGPVEEDWRWVRPYAKLTEPERACRYVHAYDRGGSYPAVTSSLPLGTGELVTLTGAAAAAAYSAKQAGYWLVEDWQWPHWGVPNPHGSTPRGRTGNTRWVTTPTLAMLHRHGVEPTIREAHTWARSPRWLSLWNARVRDARAAAAAGDGPDWAAVEATIKAASNTAIGKLAQQNARGQLRYRPHWRHTIVAKARDVIAYRIEANGARSDRWPLLAVTDTIAYASDDPDPATAWPGDPADLGRGFGKWKPAGTGQLADWGPQWLDGTRMDATRLYAALEALGPSTP